jgi:peptidoglycan/LPS O-acetylase OafA/YrhL
VKATPHDDFLDGLRGLAILMVVVAHGPVINVFLPNVGRAGVYLFFVLSAFLLSRQLYNSGIRSATLTRYFVARVFRIYPLVVSVILFIYSMRLSGIGWYWPSPFRRPLCFFCISAWQPRRRI